MVGKRVILGIIGMMLMCGVGCSSRPGKSSEASPRTDVAQKPEKKVFITQAMYEKILAEKMSEAQITEMLGKGRPSGSSTIPPGMTETVWEDSKQNSIMIQFKDGKAQGGKSTIYTNK